MEKKLTLNITGTVIICDAESNETLKKLDTPCEDVNLDFDKAITINFSCGEQVTDDELSELNVLHEFGDFMSLNFSFNNNITSEGMRKLENCDKFEHLNLFECGGITDFSFLERFTGLKTTSLVSTEIDDVGLKALKNAKDLVQIVLLDTEFPTKEGFAGFANNNEISIEIDACEFVDDEIVETIADSFPNLFELNLDLCKNITDKSVQKLAQHEKIEWLYISDCRQLTEKSLDYLAGTSSIKWLSWGQSPKILEPNDFKPLSSEEIEKISKIQSLESLSLDGITKENFSYLSALEKLKNLKWLTLGLVDKISEDQKIEFESKMFNCKISGIDY